MRIMREETFGPVLPIMAVDSLDEAIRLANDSEYGLTASGWTRNAETARRLQGGLHAGVVSINDYASSYGEPTAPWGGVKESGIGRTHGLAGLREMVQVEVRHPDRAAARSCGGTPTAMSFDACCGGNRARPARRLAARRARAQAAAPALRPASGGAAVSLCASSRNVDKLF